MRGVMGRLVAGVIVVWTLCAASMAAAQSWVQVEAQPTLAQAQTRARAYARDFPDVSGYRLRSGWYAIALGPFADDDASRQLRALRAERLIPGDSFIADGGTFTQQFWPVAGADARPAEPAAGTDPVPGVDVAALPPAGEAAIPAPPVSAAIPDPVVTPPPAEETVAEARRGEAALSDVDRVEIQTALQWEGVYDSGIDGAFGPGTRNAMAAWQASRGYSATGVLTSRQRDDLVGGYRGVVNALGLRPVRDNTAGIAVDLPMGLLRQGAYQPPFAHYEAAGDSGVQVILISQNGDRSTLFGLYDILQTLEIMPLDGPRQKDDRSFSIDGANARIVSHAEAELTAAGNVKGFILIWPAGDDKRRQLVLTAMRRSFQPLPDSVLPDSAGDGAGQSIDLLSGLEIRRPDGSATGFYVDAKGSVVTAAAAVAQCDRVTLDGDVEARVAARDADLGVAVVTATEPLVPIAFARFQPGIVRIGSEIAVSGYAYDGRLGAPVVTFGRMQDVKGLDGSDRVNRLALAATPGDAGGPVFDGGGAVVGMLLPAAAPDGTVLPAGVSFAVPGQAITAFLSRLGMTPAVANQDGDVDAETLTGKARDMTVLVSCWN